MGMDKAGFAVTAEKLRDSLWIPKGIIGFNRMKMLTPEFALPIRMKKNFGDGRQPDDYAEECDVPRRTLRPDGYGINLRLVWYDETPSPVAQAPVLHPLLRIYKIRLSTKLSLPKFGFQHLSSALSVFVFVL